MNRRQWIVIASVSVLALLTGVFTSQWISQSGLASDPSIKAFFANTWQSPDGKLINSENWRGKVLVINFWASWCPPCVEEMPALDQVSKEYAAKSVLFVGIGIDSPSNIREFLQKTPVSYPIAIGGLEGSNLAKQMGNSQGALPYTIIINPSGKSTFTKLGKISEDELKKAINSAL